MRTRSFQHRRPTPYPVDRDSNRPESSSTYANSAERRARQGIDLCLVLKDTILWQLRCRGAHWWSLEVTTIDNGMTSKGFLVKAVHPFDYHQAITGKPGGIHVSRVFNVLKELSESYGFVLDWVNPSHS